MPSSETGYRSALGHPVVRRLWAGTAVSVPGDYVGTAALMILAYQRTGRVIGPATIFAVQGIPALLSGALAGGFLDRIRREHALVGLQVAGAAAILLPLLLSGLWPLFVAAAILGAIRAATVSVRSAAIAEGVPDRFKGTTLALGNLTENLGQVLGYLTGTALTVWVGAQLALVLDAASFLTSAGILATLRLPAPRQRERRPQLSAGVRDIGRDPVLRLFALLVVVTATVGALPEALAAGVAGEDSPWTPFVFAAAPAGQALMVLLLGRTVQVRRPSFQLIHLAWLALAFGIAALGDSPAWFVVANLLVGSGVAWTLGVQVTFVRVAPPERMAQITGTMIAAIIAAEGIGTPLVAAFADATTIGTAYRAAGFLILLAAVFGWFAKERTPAALALDADGVVVTPDAQQADRPA